MLVATIVAVLICFMVQSLGAPTPGKACWERLPSDVGRNSSCVGEYDLTTVGLLHRDVQCGTVHVLSWVICVSPVCDAGSGLFTGQSKL